MPGRHASDDKRRFRRDLRRVGLLAVGLLVVLAGVWVAVRTLTGGSPDGEPAGDAPAAASSVVTAEAPPTTEPAGTTSTVPPSTAPSTTTTTEPPRPPVREPSQIGVLVLNATSVGGLAGRLTEQLAELGYRTAPPDNHTENLDSSVIWYVEGYDREASALSEHVPEAELMLFPGDAPRAPITVVLGADHQV